MFRAYAYIDNCRITTESFRTLAEAERILQRLLSLEEAPATGKRALGEGNVEEYTGIGWIIHSEVETAQIIARRREHE